MKIYQKAILPIGFKANAVASGIKKSGKLDLALLYSNIPAKAACRFTANKLEAAPIKLNKKYLGCSKLFRAIIVNSGNANCFTGNRGVRDAEETTKILAKVLGINKETILVASTGIIGRKLPWVKIKKAIPKLVTGASPQGINKAKIAIMTTDTFAKEITLKFNIGNQTVTICGIAKGAGMIAPNLATMLAFILTDGRISQRALDKALETSVDNSFNCITVDGCMSTNDSVILLANGAAGNALIDIDPVRNIAKIKNGSIVSNGVNKNFNLFVRALNIVCAELAKLIIKDAEGATKFIMIKIKQAGSFAQAKKVGLAVANSNLFKTAMYAENPNFGRIVASIGASGVDVKEKDLKIKVSPLRKKEITVEVSLARGSCGCVVYTSDITPEYIKINAAYN